jgi:hypothetical protein
MSSKDLSVFGTFCVTYFTKTGMHDRKFFCLKMWGV